MQIKNELDWICEKVEEQIKCVGSKFPSACTTEGKFRIKGNDDWTNGFWVGMIWICYEYSKNDIFLEAANDYCEDFKKRLDARYVVDHHDIGFLISPSLVARYKLFGDEEDKKYALKAADILLERFQTKGEFIQAWGELDDPEEYRFIVDSLINIPLLFWATEASGDSKYSDVAIKHFNTVIKYGIRDDYTTHHTYYFDPSTGKPIGGKTAQGFDDNSCWARGQAWVGLGTILNNRYINDEKNIDIFKKVYGKYAENLPSDWVPYWDLIFNDESNQYHDSSSAAIMLNGLIEFDGTGYENDIEKTVDNLITKYTSKDDSMSQGILKYGVYAYGIHKGVNESNLWGDYFYLEALYRLYTKRQWRGYW